MTLKTVAIVRAESDENEFACCGQIDDSTVFTRLSTMAVQLKRRNVDVRLGTVRKAGKDKR